MCLQSDFDLSLVTVLAQEYAVMTDENEHSGAGIRWDAVLEEMVKLIGPFPAGGGQAAAGGGASSAGRVGLER